MRNTQRTKGTESSDYFRGSEQRFLDLRRRNLQEVDIQFWWSGDFLFALKGIEAHQNQWLHHGGIAMRNVESVAWRQFKCSACPTVNLAGFGAPKLRLAMRCKIDEMSVML